MSMFERFSQHARSSVEAAYSLARSTFSPAIDTRHLLVALLKADGPAGTAVSAAGLEPHALAESIVAELQGGGLDKEALASVGVDLDAVREKADDAFGPGSLERSGKVSRTLRLTPEAKKALQLALRETLRLKAPEIGTGHLLLGIIRAACAGRKELEKAGADLDAMRRALETPTD
ncbi:Clp protease N-terminal domain-containing protein [bacterium RCC_150]